MVFGAEHPRSLNTQPIHGPPVWRAPPRYFEFASPTDNANGVSAQRIRELVRQHGNNILIGFDMGRTGFTTSEVHMNQEAFRVARELGVRLHAYLGGPCGPTGNSTEAGEANFRETTARRLGIDTNNSNWMDEWNSWGWREATRRQLGVLRQLGFESFEIDNIWRDRTYAAAFNQDMRRHDTAGPATTRALIDLYREAGTWDPSMRLMMKNLSVTNLQGLQQAMARGELSRTRFADFHISEESYRSQWPALERASATMGIQLAHSNNTHRYATSQAYAPGLEGAAHQLLSAGTQVASATRVNEPPVSQWQINARPPVTQEPTASWRLKLSADAEPAPQQRPT